MAEADMLQAALEELRKINRKVTRLLHVEGISTAVIVTQGGGLSDIDENLGLVMAGEFRAGNGVQPGLGFTGLRMAYPPMLYGGQEWNLAGIENDVFQVGFRASDGALAAAAGEFYISSLGIRLTEGANNINKITWTESPFGVGSILGQISMERTGTRNDMNLTAVGWAPENDSLINIELSSVAGASTHVLMSARGKAGGAGIGGLTAPYWYVRLGDANRFGGDATQVIFNDEKKDVDLHIHGDAVDDVLKVDAGLDKGYYLGTEISTASIDAQYVTLAVDATLANERVLTGTANQITITDNGAGSTVVLSTPQDIHTGASPTFGGATLNGAVAIDGQVTVDTNSGSQPFYITRTGGLLESLKIYVDDNFAIFESIQDENTGSKGGFRFFLDDGAPVPAFDIIKGGNTLFKVIGNGRFGVQVPNPLATLHVDQVSSTGAIPVLILDQGDVSEQCIEFSSDATDRDVHLFTVDVTGTPAMDWLETADIFSLNKGLKLTGTLATDGFIGNTVEKSSGYTATATDYAIMCDASGGGFTITLPAAASHTGRVYHIKKIDSSGNIVTVDGNSSETIDDATTVVLTAQYEAITIQCDGDEWFIL